MRVTAKGEYATRAVLHLAAQYPEIVTINEIADRHNIPVKYLEQILLELKRGGILESRRGVHGGYMLARPPADVSIGEVLRIVDGKFTELSGPASESLRGKPSADSGEMELRKVWENVQEAVEKILFETSFEDVCKRPVKREAASAASREFARLQL